MIVALVDNGSLEAASHLNLRAVAGELAKRVGVPVNAVSWRHSDRIPLPELGGAAAHVLLPWVRDRSARGEREFLFVPFFVSAQGAVGSSLRGELESMSREIPGGISFSFTAGLSDTGLLGSILADRVRRTAEAKGLGAPAVIIVDHGGPSRESAALRNAAAADALRKLGGSAGLLAPASLETPEGPEFVHNQPLFADKLGSPGFDRGDIVVAPLFLSPGRHAGPGGDLARIASAAEAAHPGLRVHFTDLIGSHPLAAAALERALRAALAC
jgi:hypothetical protein